MKYLKDIIGEARKDMSEECLEILPEVAMYYFLGDDASFACASLRKAEKYSIHNLRERAKNFVHEIYEKLNEGVKSPSDIRTVAAEVAGVRGESPGGLLRDDNEATFAERAIEYLLLHKKRGGLTRLFRKIEGEYGSDLRVTYIGKKKPHASRRALVILSRNPEFYTLLKDTLPKEKKAPKNKTIFSSV